MLRPQSMSGGRRVHESGAGAGGVTVSARCRGVKVAVTVVASSIVTTHVVAAPEQPPPVKPANSLLALGWAVRVTDVPSS